MELLTEYSVVILIVFAASLIKGISGFGFNLIALPLLLNYFPAKELIPILMCSSFAISFMMVLEKQEGESIGPKGVILLIFASVFTLVGVLLFNNLTEQLLIKLLAIVLMFFSVLTFFSSTKPRTLSKVFYTVFGSLLGIITGSVSVSGPPLALFLSFTNMPKKAFRNLFAWFGILPSSIAILGYYFSGNLGKQTLLFTLLFTPLLFLGTYFGRKLNHKVPQKWFRRGVIVVILIASVLLFFKE